MSQSQLYSIFSTAIASFVTPAMPQDSREQLVELLFAVSQGEVSPIEIETAFPRLESFFVNTNKWHVFLKICELLPDAQSADEVQRLFLMAGSQEDSIMYSENSLASIGSFDLRKYQQQQQQHNSMGGTPVPLYETALMIYKDVNRAQFVSEQEMLTFILFTLSGSTSQLFALSKEEIAIPDSVDTSRSSILRLLFEASLLLCHLENKCHSVVHKSQVKDAFYTQVQIILQRYKSLINEMSASQSLGHSLLDIYILLVPEIDKLKLLRNLAQNADSVAGHLFLSLLHRHTTSGDFLLRSISQECFLRSSEPYYKIIETWLLMGEIDDRNKEFFVVQSPQKHEKHALLKSFSLDSSKVPKFLSVDTCSKIFEIGSMIVFLGHYCKSYKFLNEYTEKYREFYSKKSLHTHSKREFELLIQSQHVELSSFFTKLIYTEYKYAESVKLLKEFVLQGKGDLIDALLQYSGIKGSGNGKISGSVFGHMLPNAIHNTSLKRLPKSQTNQLDTVVVNSSAKRAHDYSLNSFSINYVLDDALDYIVYGTGGLAKYLKLFNFLWRLKKIAYLLTQSWSNKSRNANYFKDKRYWKIHIVRNSLIIFFNKIMGYMNYEMIGTNFNEFYQNLKKSGSKKESFLKPKAEYMEEMTAKQYASFGIPFPKTSPCEFETRSLAQLVQLHEQYLTQIFANKLIGKYSHDISKFMEIGERFLVAESEVGSGDVDVLQIVRGVYDEFKKMEKSFIASLLRDRDMETLAIKM